MDYIGQRLAKEDRDSHASRPHKTLTEVVHLYVYLLPDYWQSGSGTLSRSYKYISVILFTPTNRWTVSLGTNRTLRTT